MVGNNHVENSADIILFAGPIQYLGSRYTKQSIGQYLPAICMKELTQDSGQSYRRQRVFL